MIKQKLKQIFLAVFVCVLFFLCFPQILQMECYTVVSGSMSPALPVGTAIYVKKKPPQRIKQGEIITFTGGNAVITHRVIENDQERQLFITKGDANAKPDAQPVKWKNVNGIVAFSIPYVGYVKMFLGTWNGKAAVLFFLLAFYQGINIFEGRKKEREID